ncbi:hypothetical protein ANOM_002426 [Aspergillus nomiae NRRL 13137]|uniref:chitinase n=1 Tax=Aspergillus nomiae NRRL (strain ATCC 15546 / NRRL 13137 / CBS 260.88 / M93) TaxID=1509407 RepID=A0A0L1JB94_ASPN3|nr:uncharacterized protein ANOM_002426 [Aspergillus nomiae NRRL 13137]KNG89019.1 hypothetical protein ANOM_002426 [Aspergillus nomiae NRRL 13137]
MAFHGPTWHPLTLLLASLVVQVFSLSISETPCDNCEPRTCSGASSKQRYIGYYESWHRPRGPGIHERSEINVEPWTHLYMPFNPFGPGYSFVAPYDTWFRKSWKDFTDLKIKRPSLKTYLSVYHYLNEENQWPNITRSFENRKFFIDQFVKHMETYGFDGLNLDLSTIYIPDYSPDEAKNFVTLLKELRESFGDKYDLSAAVEATECGLKGHDLSGMAEHLDHLTFFSFSRTKCARRQPPKTEMDSASGIELSLRLLRQANIEPNKLSMALDLTADTDKFEDPKCNTAGCPSVPNPFVNTPGFTSYEIERLIERESPEIHYNESSAYSWFIYHEKDHDFDEDRLVRFKNAEALKKRADLANKHCLGGLFASSTSNGGPASLANPNDLDPSDTSMRGARLVIPSCITMATPFTMSTQSANMSTETSHSDADTNDNTKGLSCHPAIGSVHVPIAQLDCDSNSTSPASHNSDAPVNAEEGATSSSLAAPHETGTPDEHNATGPKPIPTVAHRIGTPINSTEKADDESTTPDEPTAAP